MHLRFRPLEIRSVPALAVLLAVFAVLGTTVDPTEPKEAPAVVLVMNDDGDNSFPSADHGAAERMVRADMRALAATAVDTVAYTVGAGVLNYPTMEGSRVGWRVTALEDEPGWERIARGRAALAAGFDPIRTAAEVLRPAGKRFVLSFRINDSHFAAEPEASPLTTRFWLENRHLTLGASAPLRANESYRNLLDFGKREVREHKLALIFEALERYADVADGVQIDFTRAPVLFAEGEARKAAPLVTDFLARVRDRLATLERADGRRRLLLVRVPPSPENALWAGLDVAAWIERGLADVVIPSQLMTTAQDMPVEAFTRLAQGTNVRIVPSLHPRHSLGWRFVGEDPGTDLVGPETGRAELPFVYGAAAVYARKSADGFELFNWAARNWLRADWFRDATLKLASGAFSHEDTLVYSVPNTYYLDRSGGYEYPKALPAKVGANGSRFKIEVGVATDCREVICTLRIGIDAPGGPPHALAVALDGRRLADLEPTDFVATPITTLAPSSEGYRHRAPTHYAYVDLNEAVLLAGQHLASLSSEPPATVNAIELGTFGPSGVANE